MLLPLGLLAASVLPLSAAEPTADQLLRQMSAKLAAAQTFTFTATREIDPALLGGHGVPEKARIAAARAVSQAGARHFGR